MYSSTFVAMGLQTGTEKLAEALMLRGFPIEVENEVFTLRNGSREDYKQLKQFLEVLHIPVFWNEDTFQLLTNHFPLQKMKQIVYYRGHEQDVFMHAYHFEWRSFVTRRYGIRTNTRDLCPFTAIMVKALNEAGIVTLTGCNGHGRHAPNFQLSGTYYGAWLSIIQKIYMKDLQLHYNWEVSFTKEHSRALLIANKEKGEEWEEEKILADCYAMASVLLRHAAELRGWKKRVFKRNMKREAKMLKEHGDVVALTKWMEDVAGVYEDERNEVVTNR